MVRQLELISFRRKRRLEITKWLSEPVITAILGGLKGHSVALV